jgi:hypothetical protein
VGEEGSGVSEPKWERMLLHPYGRHEVSRFSEQRTRGVEAGISFVGRISRWAVAYCKGWSGCTLMGHGCLRSHLYNTCME